MEGTYKHQTSMQDIGERLLAFAGTGSSISLALGILEGIAIVAGAFTAIFSAIYFYYKARHQRDSYLANREK